MALLASIKNIEKTMGSKLLFKNLSFGIFEAEKIGLIGPNGSGKSTLLKLISSEDLPDAGEISSKRNIVIAHVKQDTPLENTSTVYEFMFNHLRDTLKSDPVETEVTSLTYLSIVGFDDTSVKIETLSGGWRKRLVMAVAIAQEPDLLLLDEPTNHMDWEGIEWLESWLGSFKKTLVLVSHDRAFLENSTTRTIEINRVYPDGYLSLNCNYQKFLGEKEKYLQNQMNLQLSLSNKARKEVDWLRAGVKARTTKSNSRKNRAYDLLDELSEVKSRNSSVQRKARIEIDSTNRKSKKLIELKDVSLSFGNRHLLKNLTLALGIKTCWGILGKNGSGKTSLLKLINHQILPSTGEVFQAENLKIVYFDQAREDIPQDVNLMNYLGDGSDYVIFNDQSIHVASYASRFLFPSEKMHLKISQLSGGEQARLLIAKLLLKPADVLILDEPTNDLDIESIEVLEDALINFKGLTLLVSHDRYFMRQLCHRYLALDGEGGWGEFADLDQWLKKKSLDNSLTPTSDSADTPSGGQSSISAKTKKIKLSYNEKQQWKTIEQDIQDAEGKLKKAQELLELPEILSNPEKLSESIADSVEKQKEVDRLYEAWTLLEEKIN